MAQHLNPSLDEEFIIYRTRTDNQKGATADTISHVRFESVLKSAHNACLKATK